jgi:2,4-dienoyl-CoA reductase (NADPH2)
MVNGVQYQRIDDAGLHIRVADKDMTLPVDTVVVCAGQDPQRELQADLLAAGCVVHLIGGADEAVELDAKRAIKQGTELALAFDPAAAVAPAAAPAHAALALQPAAARSLALWHAMVTAQDMGGLGDILHRKAVFRSPMAHTPYPSAQAVQLIIGQVMQVFENFAYHREMASADGLSAVLEFSASVQGKELKGVDLIQFDAQGLIVDFEVMVRPLSGLQALGEEMGKRLRRPAGAHGAARLSVISGAGRADRARPDRPAARPRSPARAQVPGCRARCSCHRLQRRLRWRLPGRTCRPVQSSPRLLGAWFRW